MSVKVEKNPKDVTNEKKGKKKKKKKVFGHMVCSTYSLMHIPFEQQLGIIKQFRKAEDYAESARIFYIENVLNPVREKDEEFDQAFRKVEFLNSKEGKNVKHSERSAEYFDAIGVLRSRIKDNGLLDENKIMSAFRKVAEKKYSIWLPNVVRIYLVKDLVRAYKEFYYGNGRNVKERQHGRITSLRSVGDVHHSSAYKIVKRDGKIYLKMWDLRKNTMNKIKEKAEERLKTGEEKFSCPRHKWIEIEIWCDKNDPLQKALQETDTFSEEIKLTRYWKKGKYRFQVQINYPKVSPRVTRVPTQKHKVAINYQTETLAYVRDDGQQAIVEMAPNSPRIIEEIKELDRYMDNSRKATNPHRVLPDGQWIKTKDCAKLGIDEELIYSNRYYKAKKKRKELFRKLRERRKLDNQILAKEIIQLGNNFVCEPNNFKSWGTKLCRMNKRAKEKYDNGIRKKDYTKMIQDRAVGQLSARASSIAEQKNLPYLKVSGFNCSTYNHFTMENDIFLTLNERLILFDSDNVSERYEKDAVNFNETFIKLRDEKTGKDYILQRDLYAAAKMLYLIPHFDKDKKGNEKITWTFDQVGFEKFFNNVFYPIHKEYVEQLMNERLTVGNQNGTILGD